MAKTGGPLSQEGIFYQMDASKARRSGAGSRGPAGPGLRSGGALVY